MLLAVALFPKQGESLNFKFAWSKFAWKILHCVVSLCKQKS